jgi:hypothetical protein
VGAIDKKPAGGFSSTLLSVEGLEACCAPSWGRRAGGPPPQALLLEANVELWLQQLLGALRGCAALAAPGPARGAGPRAAGRRGDAGARG